MGILSLSLVVLLLFQDFVLILLLKDNFKRYKTGNLPSYPRASILIPSRNEANNLPGCLSSLEKLSYPSDKIQFILGDDHSTDATKSILEAWVKTMPNAAFISIQPNPKPENQLNGKANALAQMGAMANGEVLLFTDADCLVPEGWVEKMIEGLGPEVGIVTGITTIKGKSNFEKFQAFDWWLSLGMVKVLDDLGVSITAMGNNMLITREAYDKVGGFAGIPFSLTEDFEMARSLKNIGYKGVHQISPENLIETKAQLDFSSLLEQRKRWMAGAFTLPVYWKVLLAIQVLFFPAILLVLWFFPVIGLVAWNVKIFLQSHFIHRFAVYAGENLNYSDLLLFEIYYMITAWSTIVYYFWPSKTDWKGRQYL
ncbi:hypothetical protein P872_19315 [Rhodonellum psychrophilum GCM71 = DSM 17998]|uniref:Glycosyltransferase 2-like domain-containing protein n=2 Tax=Rhodonellum TaxID=336827 RepID=U5BV37_9BACT|nr:MULTISPECIES: glycosyltransferase [Rhodonellum]ERM81738.1 hypothetical protein P872_19315 [Rhodonellum psychrophilum GCM71 = DSM 17998]SDZ55884.1 Glycosyltransferase, catalytic subunit of cellulose synthase and poly-beta-1,6-N-acetylglucosamine synthase [Rhodonellum ikkaensis]